jgi:hypothetical protein
MFLVWSNIRIFKHFLDFHERIAKEKIEENVYLFTTKIVKAKLIKSFTKVSPFENFFLESEKKKILLKVKLTKKRLTETVL